MHTELITNWDRFYTLEGEWDDLLERSRANTIFQTWEWVQAWLKTGGQKRNPYILVVRDFGGALLGVAPYQVVEYQFLKLIPYRVLCFIADHPATGSEYPDWIMDSLREEAVSQAIAKGLSEFQDDWDLIWMPNVRTWDGSEGYIRGAVRLVNFYCNSRRTDFSAFELPSDVDAYMAMLSRNQRSQLRRNVKRVMASGQMIVERCQDQSQLGKYLSTLYMLHLRRWEAKGSPGFVKRHPRQKDFYDQFAPIALKNGWLRIYVLKVDGIAKATQIGYVYQDTYFQLQEGFDPDFVSGIGNVLRMKVIEDCIAEGVREYDFLGGHSEHKRRWGAKKRFGCDLLLGNRAIKNRLILKGKVWPTGRFLRVHECKC